MDNVKNPAASPAPASQDGIAQLTNRLADLVIEMADLKDNLADLKLEVASLKENLGKSQQNHAASQNPSQLQEEVIEPTKEIAANKVAFADKMDGLDTRMLENKQNLTEKIVQLSRENGQKFSQLHDKINELEKGNERSIKEIIKWVVGLFVAQCGFIVAILKFIK